MAYRSWEVALGGAVLAAGVVFAAYAIQTTGTRLGQDSGYELAASFQSAEGVRPGTEVRIAGVKVGSVTAMTLDPGSFRAQVTVRIDPAIRLPQDSTIQVASEGLLGGSYIDILPGGAIEELAPGATFEDTQSAVSLIQLMLRFVTGGDQ